MGISLYIPPLFASHSSPPSEPLSAGVVALAAGYHYTCGLLTSGSVYCWGLNNVGELGTGDTSNRLTPTAVTGLGAGDTIYI